MLKKLFLIFVFISICTYSGTNIFFYQDTKNKKVNNKIREFIVEFENQYPTIKVFYTRNIDQADLILVEEKEIFSIDEVLLDLNSIFKDKNELLEKNEIVKNQVNYSIPYYLTTLGIYYNKEIFEKNGISPYNIKSFNDFYSILKQLKKGDVQGVLIPYNSDLILSIWETIFFKSGGSYFKGEKRLASGINGAESKYAFSFFRDVNNFGGEMATNAFENFLDGNSAMCIDFSDKIPMVNSNDNIGVFAIPEINEKRLSGKKIGFSIIDKGYIKNRSSMTFVKFLLADRRVVELSKYSGVVPAGNAIKKNFEYRKYLMLNDNIRAFHDVSQIVYSIDFFNKKLVEGYIFQLVQEIIDKSYSELTASEKVDDFFVRKVLNNIKK